jgi:hypothetical protein
MSAGHLVIMKKYCRFSNGRRVKSPTCERLWWNTHVEAAIHDGGACFAENMQGSAATIDKRHHFRLGVRSGCRGDKYKYMTPQKFCLDEKIPVIKFSKMFFSNRLT